MISGVGPSYIGYPGHVTVVQAPALVSAPGVAPQRSGRWCGHRNGHRHWPPSNGRCLDPGRGRETGIMKLHVRRKIHSKLPPETLSNRQSGVRNITDFLLIGELRLLLGLLRIIVISK